MSEMYPNPADVGLAIHRLHELRQNTRPSDTIYATYTKTIESLCAWLAGPALTTQPHAETPPEPPTAPKNGGSGGVRG